LAGVGEPTIPHGGLLNIKTGFKGVCRVVELSTPLVLQWFAGLFGNAEIGLVLTKKNDKKKPAEIILHACAFMNYWAGLYNAELQGMLEDGVKVLLSYTYRALS